MFSSFLRESSIHGLRYVAEARNAVARVIWSACVVTCVVSAAVIIYFNVRNWENSPAVVTTVAPELVKGKPFMPMVTVCPHRPNFNNILMDLLSDDPQDLIKAQHVDEVARIIAYNHVDADYRSRKVSAWDHRIYAPMFSPCAVMTDVMASSPECRFVELLHAIAYGAGNNRDVVYDVAKAYITESVVAGEKKLSMTGLRKFVEEYGDGVIALPPEDDDDGTVFAAEAGKEKTTWVSHSESVYPAIAELYSNFFPVYKDRATKRLDRLRAIEEYVPPAGAAASGLIRSMSKAEFVSLLAFAVDHGRLANLNDPLHRVVSELLFESMSSFLGVAAAASAEDVHLLVNSVTYEPTVKPFLVRVHPRAQFEYPCGDDFNVSGEDLCRLNASSACQHYCRLVVHNITNRALAKALLSKGEEYAGPLRPNYPRSLLPTCRYPSADRKWTASTTECWNRVVTDRGVCFSSRTDGSKSVIVGAGKSAAGAWFRFSLDNGERIYLENYLPDSLIPYNDHDILVTAPNHHAIGRTVDEDGGAVLAYHLSYTAGAAADLDYVTSATPEFAAMHPNKRNCLYSHEKSLRAFPDAYSETDCLLECAWTDAAASCGCAPWYLTTDLFPESKTCEAYGNRCFKAVVDGRYERSGGCYEECLPDCRKVHYTIQQVRKKQNGDAHESYKNADNEIYFDYATVNKTAQSTDVIRRLLDSLEEDEPLSRISQIDVFVRRKTTLEITSTATVTLVDMISNVGGTLGLFCGFSILSAVEIAYWAAEFVAGRWRRQGKKAF